MSDNVISPTFVIFVCTAKEMADLALLGQRRIGVL